MTTSPIALLIAALVAGSAAAVGTVSLVPSQAPAEDPAASSALIAVESLRDEVSRLVDEQAALRRELQNVELRMSTSGSSNSVPEVQPMAGNDPELLELKQQVAQLSVKVGGGEPGEPQVIETVSAALEQIREQEDAEAREARAEARKERQEERLGELTDILVLDGYQETRLQEVMASYGESSDVIVEGARKTNDWGGMRGKFDTLNTEVTEMLGGFLQPDQVDEFEKLGGPRILTGDGWWGRMNDTSKKDDEGES